jgi:hypothetical protein
MWEGHNLNLGQCMPCADKMHDGACPEAQYSRDCNHTRTCPFTSGTLLLYLAQHQRQGWRWRRAAMRVPRRQLPSADWGGGGGRYHACTRPIRWSPIRGAIGAGTYSEEVWRQGGQLHAPREDCKGRRQHVLVHRLPTPYTGQSHRARQHKHAAHAMQDNTHVLLHTRQPTPWKATHTR